jgi:hypothetical protein
LAVVIGAGLATAAYCLPPVVEFGIGAPGPGALAGIYTDPYQGYVGGGPLGNYSNVPPPAGSTAVAAFCDDFTNDVTPPQYWTAFDTDLSTLSAVGDPVASVYYGDHNSATDGTPTLNATQQVADYIAIAYLAYESLQAQATNQLLAQEQYSYALWDIFDPGLLQGGDCWEPGECLDQSGTTNLTAAIAAVNAALAVGNQYATAHPTDAGLSFENDYNVSVQIYTPENNGAVSPLSDTARPQEFVTLTPLPTNGVPMPEPSSLASLGIDFVGVALLGLAFRRRQSQSRS